LIFIYWDILRSLKSGYERMVSWRRKKMMEAAWQELGDVRKLLRTQRICRILSTGEPSLSYPMSPQDRRFGDIIQDWKIGPKD